MTPRVGLYRHPHFLEPALVEALSGVLLSTPGELAAVQPQAGGPLAVTTQVRRVLEIELPDGLHDRLLARIESIRGALATAFGVRLEPCEAVAALRYPPGAFYRTHRDAGDRPDPFGLHRRAVSLVIFLNAGEPHPDAAFGGGRLRLHEGPGTSDGPIEIVPAAGTLVAFASSVLHEVGPVTWGTRLAIAAWLLRPEQPRP
jgi:predicted 2-oxoglutarate/Fe(II)-dependent dioxygenase YbiX